MLALFLALASPELDVRGVSVSYGNTVVENAYRNAVAILRRAGKRTTLGVGARRPLKRGLAVARETHGESGLGYASVPPAGVILDFVKSLDRLLAEQPAPVTLVTLGPVTSLALAWRRDPDLVRAKVARHIAMIGNVAAQGNTTRYSEFNAWCDPEALDIVLRAELPTEMVGLDVTREMVLAPHEITRLQHAGAGAEHAHWIQDALRFYVDFHKQQERLVVDLDDGEHRGHTRIDSKEVGPLVKVATEVDVSMVRPLLSERVFRWAVHQAASPIVAQETPA